MRPASWAVLVAVVVWSVASTAPPTASAQALDPAVTVEAREPRVLVPHDETVLARWTVTNDGPADATIALSLDGATGAWSTDFGQRYDGPFTLSSGTSYILILHVSTSATGSEPLPEGLLRLSAVAQDATGRTATGAAEAVLVYGPEPSAPLPPPDHKARNALLGAGALAVLVAAAYVAFGRTVAVRAPASDVVVPGRGAWMRMEVVNRAPWTRTVRVRARTDPGTVATTDADVVLVPARGVRPLTLFFRQAGEDGRVAVEARTRGYRWRRRTAVRVAAQSVQERVYVDAA